MVMPENRRGGGVYLFAGMLFAGMNAQQHTECSKRAYTTANNIPVFCESNTANYPYPAIIPWNYSLYFTPDNSDNNLCGMFLTS
jgi:hypothetical protein